MNEKDFENKFLKLREEDRELALKFAEEYDKDSLADEKVLMSKAQAALGRYEGLKAEKDATAVSPLTYAFNESESGLRNLVDPNSPSNWMNMSSQALLDAAIAGGYVKRVPASAPEWKKQEQRKNFGKFLGILGQEMADQSRRNAVSEFERESQFSKNPLLWLAKGAVPTYTLRAKEQALKGTGATTLDQLSMQDLGTLGLDIGANTMLGAGAAGISKGALVHGVGDAAKNYGLRSMGNVAGSDFAAGLLGGGANVLNRGLNTDEGVQLYEYGTEPLLTGALNVIATPAALRQSIRQGAHLIGLGAEKINGIGKKKALGWAQNWADQKYAEPALASQLRDLEATAGTRLDNSIVTPETQAKIENMYAILNDGATTSPGKNTSLLDDLQQLYVESSSKPLGVEGEVSVEGVLNQQPWREMQPNIGRFYASLNKKIANLEGQLKNEVGKESAPAVQRELDYYKNFRELMDNDLIDVYKYLNYADQPEMLTYKAPNLTAGPGDNVPVFELGKKASTADIELMKDYISNVVGGTNLVLDDGMMYRIELLKNKYPEFGRYVNSIETVPTEGGLSLWPSLGRSYQPMVHYNRAVSPRASYEFNSYDFKPNGASVAAIAPNAKRILEDVAKPMVVQSRLRAHDKPDTSLEALEAKMEKLRANKPVATDAALNWKYDPRIEESKQLTAEERNLVNQYRAAKLDAAMNGR